MAVGLQITFKVIYLVFTFSSFAVSVSFHYGIVLSL